MRKGHRECQGKFADAGLCRSFDISRRRWALRVGAGELPGGSSGENKRREPEGSPAGGAENRSLAVRGTKPVGKRGGRLYGKAGKVFEDGYRLEGGLRGGRFNWKDRRRGGMARPQKIGLDYFPFDVDFFADRKIKVLFARFGSDGVTFYLYILCEIYRDKGFFVQCDDEFLEVASAELQIGRETLLRLLDFMVERQLIHGELLEKFGVLTSRGIQARYQRAKENAGRKTPVPVRRELWLMGGRETSAFIQVREEDLLGEAGRRFAKNIAAKGRPPARGKSRTEAPAGEERNGGKESTPRRGKNPEAPSGPEKGRREADETGISSPLFGQEADRGGHSMVKIAGILSEEARDDAGGEGMERPACGGRQEADSGGALPVEEGVLPDGERAGTGRREWIREEMSSVKGRCSSSENSGGNNPQRKQKNRKGKEKGGEEALPGVRQMSGGAVRTEDGGCAVFGGEDGEKAGLSRSKETLDGGAWKRGNALEKSACEEGNALDTAERSGGGAADVGCGPPAGFPAVPGAEEAVKLVREAFVSVPRNFRREIEGFLRQGAPLNLVRYAVEEALRLGKPYSYMAAILRQRLAEGRLDVGIERRSPASYDLEEFEKLGFHVPKVP